MLLDSNLMALNFSCKKGLKSFMLLSDTPRLQKATFCLRRFLRLRKKTNYLTCSKLKTEETRNKLYYSFLFLESLKSNYKTDFDEYKVHLVNFIELSSKLQNWSVQNSPSPPIFHLQRPIPFLKHLEKEQNPRKI